MLCSLPRLPSLSELGFRDLPAPTFQIGEHHLSPFCHAVLPSLASRPTALSSHFSFWENPWDGPQPRQPLPDLLRPAQPLPVTADPAPELPAVQPSSPTSSTSPSPARSPALLTDREIAQLPKTVRRRVAEHFFVESFSGFMKERHRVPALFDRQMFVVCHQGRAYVFGNPDLRPKRLPARLANTELAHSWRDAVNRSLGRYRMTFQALRFWQQDPVLNLIWNSLPEEARQDSETFAQACRSLTVFLVPL